MRKFNLYKVKFNKVFLIKSGIVLFSRLYTEKKLVKGAFSIEFSRNKLN